MKWENVVCGGRATGWQGGHRRGASISDERVECVATQCIVGTSIIIDLLSYLSYISPTSHTKHTHTVTIPTPRCDDLDKLKAFIPSLRDEIKGDRAFKEFYLFCYGFSKVKGQRSLDKETAIAMFGLLLEVRSSLPIQYASSRRQHIHSHEPLLYCPRQVVGSVVWEWGLFSNSHALQECICTTHHHVHVLDYFYRTD